MKRTELIFFRWNDFSPTDGNHCSVVEEIHFLSVVELTYTLVVKLSCSDRLCPKQCAVCMKVRNVVSALFFHRSYVLSSCCPSKLIINHMGETFEFSHHKHFHFSVDSIDSFLLRI